MIRIIGSSRDLIRQYTGSNEGRPEMMNRRDFFWVMCKGALASITWPLIAGDPVAADAMDGIQTFAYYQGLRPTESRSAARTDGTIYKMPFITADQIRAGEPLNFEFWHGHTGKSHRFMVTADDLRRVSEGEDVEIYTDVIEGHRHAVRLPRWVPVL